MTSGWVSHRGMKRNWPRKPGVAAERPVVSLGHKTSRGQWVRRLGWTQGCRD